jgi:hypothetical protein
MPIRKIGPNTVALSSYYGKTFIMSGKKMANNSLEWIIKRINVLGITDGSIVSKVAPGDVFNNNFKAPYIYNGLSNTYRYLKIKNLNLYFDHNSITSYVSEDIVKQLEVNGSIVVGITDDHLPIEVDTNNIFYVVNNGSKIELGDIFTILDLDISKSPVEYTEVRVFSKPIPVGIVLGYFLGFETLLKLLKVDYTTSEEPRVKLDKYQYKISFKNITYIFSRKDKLSTLILGGFLLFDKQLTKYDSSLFNSKDIYFNLLTSIGLSVVYIRELELLNQLFIDPITKSILETMNKPVTYIGLLIEASKMLLTYNHPDSQDMKDMRISGYERMSGTIYKELVTSIRQYKGKHIRSKAKIDMSPYTIWQSIMTDPAKKIVEDINPIQNLKEQEIVTYVGNNGRSKETINKKTRAYHENDIGLISEATVDSSDVGINAYTSSNPKFTSLRGMTDTTTPCTTTNMLSTSANLAPAIHSDDPKRVINIAPYISNYIMPISLIAGNS